MNNEFNGWGQIKPVKQSVYNPWNPVYTPQRGPTGATGPMGPSGSNKAIVLGGYFFQSIKKKTIIPWQYVSFTNSSKIFLDVNNNLKIVGEGTYLITQSIQVNNVPVTDAVIALYLTNDLENFEDISVNLINPGTSSNNSMIQYSFTTVFQVKENYLKNGAAYLVLYNGSTISLDINRIETTILELN